MQPELKQKLEESARANNRSMNAELVARLEASFAHGTIDHDIRNAIDTRLAESEDRLTKKIQDLMAWVEHKERGCD